MMCNAFDVSATCQLVALYKKHPSNTVSRAAHRVIQSRDQAIHVWLLKWYQTTFPCRWECICSIQAAVHQDFQQV